MCPSVYGVMRNLDAIIRVRMVLCETSMLLFVFRIMFVFNPGLHRARPLWPAASDKLITHIFPAERKFMFASMVEVVRKLSSNI